MNARAFADVPLPILERAAARGDTVHSEIAMTLLGLWFVPDEAVAGYLASFNIWREKFVVEVVAVEPELVAPKYGVQGHPDAILRLAGDKGLTLVDWKTPKPLSRSWRLQLAGYKLLAEANGHEIVRVASLRPDAAGGPAKFDGYTDTLWKDTNAFLSALNVWKFFNE